MGTTDGGTSAKTRGRPQAGQERRKRKSRAADKAAAGGTPAAAATVKRGREYELMFSRWLTGRSKASLAAEHGLSVRRVREVIDELRAGAIMEQQVGDPWMGHRFAENLLLRRVAALDEAAAFLQRAQAAGNHAVELGAMRRRDEALTAVTALMQETGWLPRDLSTLKVQTETVEIAKMLVDVLERHKIPKEASNEIAEIVKLHTRRAPNGALELDVPAGNAGPVFGT